MKKLSLALAVMPCLFALLASCSNDDNEFHTLNIRAVSSDSNPIGYYADQTNDSLEVVSSDSWQANTNCDWIKFNTSSLSTINYNITYVYGQALRRKERITLSANTTGADRETSISVEANKKTVRLIVKQLGYLNVTQPAKSQAVNTSPFLVRLNSSDVSTKIAFTVYAATSITTTNSWITVPNETYVGTKDGVAFEANISLTPNTTGTSRTGKVTLVSTTGASTDIEIIQGA